MRRTKIDANFILSFLINIGFINTCSKPHKEKENKNPYSNKGYTPRSNNMKWDNLNKDVNIMFYSK